MTFEELPEFEKDKKQLQKKYKTIYEDLEDVKRVLKIRPNEHPPFSFQINNLDIQSAIIKVKKSLAEVSKEKV